MLILPKFSYFNRFALAAAIFLFCASSTQAIPLAEYRQNVRNTAQALESLQKAVAGKGAANVAGTLNYVRQQLPAGQKVELQNGEFDIDNSWLEASLKEIEAAPREKQSELLQAAGERLGAIEQRLRELEAAQAAARSKSEDKQKLEEILRRPEFQKPQEEKEKSVLEKWYEAFAKWLESLFPRRPPQPAGEPPADLAPVGTILNYLVIALALGIIGFNVWRVVMPLVGNNLRLKKPKKKEPRVILGEQLAPDATAEDLLTQADGLAQNGEIRAAIRKGYIALLCELNDRKILGLARHKTNRDYLRDVRQRQEIFQPMRILTGSFERHWYGSAPAEENDWQEFRGRYREIVQSPKSKVQSLG